MVISLLQAFSRAIFRVCGLSRGSCASAELLVSLCLHGINRVISVVCMAAHFIAFVIMVTS